jgi:single-strand DNA-binding protein
MNETMVTVLGFVGTKPELRPVGETCVAGFRVGSTPRVFSQRDNTWSDRETNWYTVNAWRTLGEHCAESLRVGEPIIVHGRLRTRTWADEGGTVRTALSLDAVAVGHDLSRGSSAFVPDRRPASQPTAEDQELAKQNAQWTVDLPQVSSRGHFEQPPVDVTGLEEAPSPDLAEEPELAPF